MEHHLAEIVLLQAWGRRFNPSCHVLGRERDRLLKHCNFCLPTTIKTAYCPQESLVQHSNVPMLSFSLVHTWYVCSRSGKVLGEPLDPLLNSLIQRFPILITRPIRPERKAMNLVFIDLKRAVSNSSSSSSSSNNPRPASKQREKLTRSSCGKSTFFASKSWICPTVFISSTLSLDPTASDNGTLTGSKSSGTTTALGWHASAASTPPIDEPLPSFFCPCASKMAYLPPQQNPMAPILLVPGIERTVLMKPSISGFVMPSVCLGSHVPSVTGTMAAFLALSATLSVSWVLRLGSMLSRKERGIGSPFSKSGM